MSGPGRHWRLRRVLRLLLLAGLIALWVVFDWNWLRQPVARYLSEQAGRPVQIESLAVQINGRFEPTVTLGGLQIENSAWADARRPFIRARAAGFTFSWQSVVERRPVLSRLRLVDADVDLERQADGLRNWRLRNPDDRGPGRVKVMRLQAERSRIRFAHRGVGLDIVLASSALAQPLSLAQSPLRLTQQIDFSGVYQGSRFQGQVRAPEVLSFMQTAEAFPLQGQLASGGNRFEIDGLLSDLFDLSTADASVQLSGPNLASLGSALNIHLPPSAAFKLQARWRKEERLPGVSFQELKADIGQSTLQGEIDFDPSGERPLWNAKLSGDQVRSADFSPADAGEHKAARPAQEAEGKQSAAADFIGPSWQRLDAHLELKLKNLDFDAAPSFRLHNLQLVAHLEDGRLELSPLRWQMAGGQAIARIQADSRSQPASAEIDLSLKQLRIEKLLPEQKEKSQVAAPLDATLRLAGRGTNWDSLAASSGGFLELSLGAGRLASALEAKLALDGGKMLRGLFTGERPVPLRCGVLAFDIRHGQGRLRQFWLDTEHTQIRGQGSLDLPARSFDLRMAPHSKDDALLALNKPLRIQGGIGRSFEVGLSPEPVTAAGSPGCKLQPARKAQAAVDSD